MNSIILPQSANEIAKPFKINKINFYRLEGEPRMTVLKANLLILGKEFVKSG